MTGGHVIAAGRLPSPHKDRFDRFLIAQATAQGAALLTADAGMAPYGKPARLVG